MAFEKVKENLERRGFAVRTFDTAKEAADYLNGAVDGTTVGFGGSVTIQTMGLYDMLSGHNEVFWHWVSGPDARRAAAAAKIYVTSMNGLAETGEMVNIDGGGNRVASTLYGHEKVYIIIGRNKLAPDFEQALWRARNIAGPKNAQRMNLQTPCAAKGDRCYDCSSPQRICRGAAILWGPMVGMETEVLLIDQDLGF